MHIKKKECIFASLHGKSRGPGCGVQ